MKLFRGPPDEIDEFFHQKKLDDLKFNIRRMVCFSIFAFFITVIIMYANKDKYPPGEAEKLILIGGAAIIILLLFVSWYSRFLQKITNWLWELRKNQ